MLEDVSQLYITLKKKQKSAVIIYYTVMQMVNYCITVLLINANFIKTTQTQ